MKIKSIKAKAKYSPQNTAILNYINENGGITAREAMNILFIGNLKGRICELRKAGYDLPIEKVRNDTNTGYHARYMFTANDAVKFNG